jgi:acetyl-CoA carboxylase biotin carboxylase subunit
VAAGRGLSRRQDEVLLNGWALECRVTAEDPYDDFLPSLGRVDYVSEPHGPGIRVDSALYAGGELPYYYDPMVAKVIAWGRTREEAIQRMRRALREFIVVGIETNIPFHLQLLEDERFLAGRLHTRFLDEFTLSPLEEGEEREAALLAAALLTHQRANHRVAPAAHEDGSRWRSLGRLAESRAAVWVRGSRWGRSTG